MTADFDLHGYLGIRLLDANEDDVDRVERQLGPIRTTLSRDPDVVIRFVDRIQPRGVLTYVKWPEAAFDDSHFYLVRGRGNVAGLARVPFDDIGGTCVIECERSLTAVPLLLAIINMTATAKGLLPLHASAFTYEGRGVVVAGWAKGGKTETLLSFMSEGAAYVGDEWVYLAGDGQMFGIPEPIRLWRWQVDQLPKVAATLSRGARTRLAALDMVARGAGRMAPRGSRLGFAGSVLRRAVPILARQAYVQVPPVRLFGEAAIALRGQAQRLIFATVDEGSTMRVHDAESDEVARRMASSLLEERQELLSFYRQFRFAFPGRRSSVIDASEEMERQLLSERLSPLPAVWFRHPYPVDIPGIYSRVRPYVVG